MAPKERIPWRGFTVTLVLLLLAAGVAWLWHLHRRALPVPLARAEVRGVSAPVDLLWDEWGVPHVFAATESDAAFGLGWAVARERLFQLVLIKHLTQGRLAELFGSDAVKADRLFRTLDLQGQGKRMAAQASPAVREAITAYTAGVNAYAAHLGSRLPVEFSLLHIDWEPLQDDDLLGLVGYMTWGLHEGWQLDPLYHKLEEKLGPERAASLFPDAAPAARRRSVGAGASLPTLIADAAGSPFGDWAAPPLGASNSWVVAPSRSASGHALLSSDPHLPLGLPGVWYEAHVATPTLDVSGVTLPGLPLVVIGHNRRIAWGMTTLMADLGDFFLERIDPGPPARVEYKGQWVPLREQRVTIRVRLGTDESYTIRRTPHGPLVTDLLPDEKEALSYQWTLYAAADANDFEAFYRLDHAGSWREFRAAVGLMGSVAQNVTYADRDGHIGMQTSGRVPMRKGPVTGLAIRKGWDGSEDWAGFVPFDRMPSGYDPPEGWLATSNNLPFDKPTAFYLAPRYEPPDRYLRERERLSQESRWTPEGFGALENDVLWPAARQWAPRVAPACAADAAARNVPLSDVERRALALFNGWDGRMAADAAAPALFAGLYRQWFTETFADKLGAPLLKEVEDIQSLPANFLRVAWERDPTWFDRTGTPEHEGVDTILCWAFRKAVAALSAAQGNRPEAWRWGASHRLTLGHPLSRAKALAWYFSRGPYPRPGSAETVNKEQSAWTDDDVKIGASTRQIVDLGNPAQAWSVIPGGQSGIPASSRYNDQTPLWLSGSAHPTWMDRTDIERHLSERTQLVPAPAQAPAAAKNCASADCADSVLLVPRASARNGQEPRNRIYADEERPTGAPNRR